MNDSDHHCLLVTAGNGPNECNLAVSHVLDRMEKEAASAGLSLAIHPAKGQNGPKSAVIVVHGVQRQAFVDNWTGTIL